MIEFNGDKSPVSDDTLVRVRTNKGVSKRLARDVNWIADVYEFEVVDSGVFIPWNGEPGSPVHDEVWVEVAFRDGDVSKNYFMASTCAWEWSEHSNNDIVKYRVVPDPFFLDQNIPDQIKAQSKSNGHIIAYIAYVEADLEFANKQEAHWIQKLEKAKQKLSYWKAQQEAIHLVHGRLISGGANGVEKPTE